MSERRPLVLNADRQLAELPSGDRLPISTIATGTPDGTKFVRDDGTLATPSGSGPDYNIDGGTPSTVYGGSMTIDAGGP